MKLLVLAALCVALVAARPHRVNMGRLQGQAEPSFEQWKAMFKPEGYADDLEESVRKVVYQNNVRFIESENRKGLSYTLGVNQFADMTNEEFAARFTIPFNRTRPSKEAWLDEYAAPDSMDWRQHGAVTPVKNQGQCGSCWSFSTTGSTEGAWKIAGNSLVSLSEQQLMDCSVPEGDHGCNGGLMDYAFEYIQKNGGVDSEQDYPYTARDGSCNQEKEKKDVAKITGYSDVPHNNENQLKAAVAKQPVSVAIEADQSSFQFYKNGVFKGPCGTQLDHGVLAVGYGTDAGTDYWIVKNSWGESWGDQGYIMMERGSSGSGMCGIAMQPSYPHAGSGPAPPSPPGPSPPPPPSPPSPSGGHYGDPNKGPCKSDEEAVRIQNLQGAFCSPSCSASSPCPTDIPDDATAKPECILEAQGSSQPTNCAMVCNPLENSKDGANPKCPTNATCKPISIIGVCTYNS